MTKTVLPLIFAAEHAGFLTLVVHCDLFFEWIQWMI
jgi:hypothetical protein